MELFPLIIATLFGLVLGMAVIFVPLKSRLSSSREVQVGLESEARFLKERVEELKHQLAEAEKREDQLQSTLSEVQRKVSDLEARKEETERAVQEKQALLEKAEENLKDSFSALSAKALKSNNESFLELAKSSLEKFQQSAQGDLSKRQEAISNLVKPLKESLGKVDQSIQEIEKKRSEAYGSLTEQIKHLMTTQQALQAETGNLVKALRAPQVRGQWGEIQLRRTVEMAGMLSHVDFLEQESVSTEEGGQRPDMVVEMPSGRQVVVDAKAPLAAYLDALEAKDVESQIQFMKQHARQIRDHLKKLGAKSYWKQFDPTPEFVVLFLPGETFFSAALEQDPGLIEYGVEQRVILATPTTLIALLKAVAYGWKQEEIAKEAKTISEQGKIVYDRLRILSDRMGKLGTHLGRTVSAFNETARTTDARLLPAARRLKELHASSDKPLESPPLVQEQPDPPRASELDNENKPSREHS